MFFEIVGVASVIAGSGLLLVGGHPDTPDKPLGRWLKHNLWEVFERPRRVEWFIYRHHRLFGGAIVVATLLLLVLLYAKQARLLGAIPSFPGPGIRGALLLVWALVAAVLVIGIAVLIRPSVLKSVEALSNRWVNPFPATIRRSRQIGILLVVVGIACLATAFRISS